jgi:DHA1 family multidrug resistance protein-like MFS transporter
LCFIRLTNDISVLEAIPVIFIDHHGLTVSQDGLIFLGVGIGTTIGAVSSIYIRGDENKRLVKEWRGFPPPEQRLYPATIGAPLLVIGSFWLGWTGAYSSVPWYVPAIGTIVIGTAISLLFLSCMVCPYYAYLYSCANLNLYFRPISWTCTCEFIWMIYS